MTHPLSGPASTWGSIVKTDDLIGVCIAATGVTHWFPAEELDNRLVTSAVLKTLLAAVDIDDTDPTPSTGDELLLLRALTGEVERLNLGQLYDLTLASTDITTFVPPFPVYSQIAADDGFLVWDLSQGNFKRLTMDMVMRYLRITTENHTGDFTLTTADGFKRHTNRGATAAITASVPAFAAGWKMRFFRHTDHPYYVAPSGSETIAGGGAGKKLLILSRGDVELECLTPGEAEVVGGSAVVSEEL